ncbi:MAG: PilZ domain-containing protein [Gammaproteobacteria bacterium]
MESERRRYFRITDRALVKYRVLADEALDDERRFVFLNEVRAANLHGALMGIDIRLGDLFEVVRNESKATAEALELMNRKLTLLERVVAMETSTKSPIDYRENAPLDVSLSGGGMAMPSEERLEPGTHLAIDLVLLPSNHPMRVIGRVVECSATERGTTLSVEFVDMREEDRDVLIQHIVRKQSEELRQERAAERGHAA